MGLEKINEVYFKEVYAETKNTVYLYIYARAKNREDAVDIFQEVYMELVKILKTHGSSYINSPAAFLTDIAKKKLYAYYKCEEKLPTFPTDVFFSYQDESIIHIENVSADRETVSEIYDALKNKDEITLKIFFLYFQADMKLSEIAEQTDDIQHAVELPDPLVYFSWLCDEHFGCGDDNVVFVQYTENGTIYDDFEKDADLSDYVPPLLKYDYIDSVDAWKEENAEKIQADIIANLKKYLELIDFNFDELTFVKDENPEDFSQEIPLEANTCVFKRDFFSGYRLYVNINAEIELTVTKNDIVLQYYPGNFVTENARLCKDESYGDLLLNDVYFTALAEYFGLGKLTYIASSNTPPENWLPYLVFYSADAKTDSELLDSYYVSCIEARAAFYEDGYVLVYFNDAAAYSTGVETEIPFVGYDNAYKAAKKRYEEAGYSELNLIGCTLTYWASADNAYWVPCYVFDFCVEESQEGMTCFTAMVPCYDFSEYFAKG